MHITEHLRYKENGNGTFVSPTGVFQEYFITSKYYFFKFYKLKLSLSFGKRQTLLDPVRGEDKHSGLAQNTSAIT